MDATAVEVQRLVIELDRLNQNLANMHREQMNMLHVSFIRLHTILELTGARIANAVEEVDIDKRKEQVAAILEAHAHVDDLDYNWEERWI